MRGADRVGGFLKASIWMRRGEVSESMHLK